MRKTTAAVAVAEAVENAGMGTTGMVRRKRQTRPAVEFTPSRIPRISNQSDKENLLNLDGDIEDLQSNFSSFENPLDDANL